MQENKQMITLDPTDLKSVETIISKIEDSYFEIPFGNTAFQTKAFVVAASITPERAYRAVGLQLMSILSSLRMTIIDKKIAKVKLEQKREKLKSPDLDKFEKEILELEILMETSGHRHGEKLINDSLQEFNVLYAEFMKLPKFTREQFESAEENYFSQSLDRQARGISGAVESLINMHDDMPALASYKENVKLIENLDTQTLKNLRLNMDNQMSRVIEKEQLKLSTKT